MFVVDASVWVARYVADDVHHARARQWIFDTVSRGLDVFEPSIVLPELAGAVARRTGNARYGVSAATELTALPGIDMVPVDTQLARLSAELAASLGLRGADAAYVATAVEQEAVLITLDQEMMSRAASVVPSSGPVGTPDT